MSVNFCWEVKGLHFRINDTVLLYCRYTSNSDYLTTDDLLLFLEAEQGVMFPTHCLQRKRFHMENISEFIYKKRQLNLLIFITLLSYCPAF